MGTTYYSNIANDPFLGPHKLINFGKRMLTYGVIAEIQRFQLVGYRLHLVERIGKHVKDLPPVSNEKAYAELLYQTSLLREPRGAERVP
jgi:hypothetical protein